MRVEDELLLLAVNAQLAAHRTRAAQLLQAADSARLVAELRRLRVLPVLGERLARHVELPRHLRAAIDEARRTNALHGMLAEAHTRELHRALEAEGIRMLALKGQSLAVEAHGAPDMRDSTDIDVLVPVERLWDATAVLERKGYRVSTRGPELPSLHVVAAHRTEARPAIELHWRIHWYEESFSRRLLDTSTAGRDGFLHPDPATMFTSLLSYYARDGFAGLRLLADVVGFAERHPAVRSPGVIADEARRHPSLLPAIEAAARSVRRLTGLTIPGVGEELSRRQRLAVRLADPLQRSPLDQRVAVTHLVDGLLSPRGGGREYLLGRLTMFDTRAGNTLHLARTGVRWSIALATVASPARRGTRVASGQ